MFTATGPEFRRRSTGVGGFWRWSRWPQIVVNNRNRPLWLAWWCAAVLSAAGIEEFEQPPIEYSASAPRDAVSRLEARVAAGEVRLAGDERSVVLSLLAELRVPVESQMLVFSKTSLQRARIRGDHPRAIFFSDDCYVGWVPGGLVEVADLDPQLGPVFYAFDPRAEATAAKPRFTRDPGCLSCHGGHFVREIPAVLARSVPTESSGEPLLQFGSQLVDYRTPFTERWGGWYVTGTHGATQHRGNTFARDDHGQMLADFARGANVTSLERFVDLGGYLTNSSDITALLVFEHQIATHNALTRAAFKCRRMLEYQRNLQRDLKEPITDEPSFESVKAVFEHRAQEVADHLLFYGEAPLPPAGVKGSLAFQARFTSVGPRTRDGQSLRQLRLAGRLFENRCSYLIYSESFRALPLPLKRSVYAKLARALRADEPDPRYAYLETNERARIRAILRETCPEVLEAWSGESHRF